MKILLMYIYTTEYPRVNYQYITASNIKMLSNGKNMGFNLCSSQPDDSALATSPRCVMMTPANKTRR